MTTEIPAMASEKTRSLARAQYPSYDRTSLPTLKEVLTRKTAPPVCLFNFYIFMRDRECAEEYLDFWLDVTEHELLCKYYVREMQRIGQDVSAEFPEYIRYLEMYKGKSRDVEKRFSNLSASASADGLKRNLSASSRGSIFTEGTSRSASPSPQTMSSPTPASLSLEQSTSADAGPRDDSKRHPGYRDSVRSNTTGNLSWIGQRAITRDDIAHSAQRIYVLYIVSNSERGIDISDHIRRQIDEDIKSRDDPGVFRQAKMEVYELMKRDSFPRFIKARAYGNMTTQQTMVRLGLGLFGLFVGFATELSLIFLDEKPRSKRLWGFLPIFFGVMNLFANQTELSPIFVLLKISERTPLKFEQVREKFIYEHIQVPKGLWIFSLSLIVSVVITGIFVAVPGHRL